MKFKDPVTTLDELRALMGEPSELARKKQIDHLDMHCRAYIAHAPFLLIGTADAAGRCDVSPKGDAPGFVRVLDDRHLVIPDRPGNKRSSLWQPDLWPDISDMAPAACMLFDHAKPTDMTVEDMARRLDVGYKTTLY